MKVSDKNFKFAPAENKKVESRFAGLTFVLDI